MLAWALGIEVISPEFVTEEEIHSASERLGLEPPPAGNLAPLRAAYIGTPLRLAGLMVPRTDRPAAYLQRAISRNGPCQSKESAAK